MAKFRSRPVEVEAIQWTGLNEDDLVSFTRGEFNALAEDDRANSDDPEATAQLFETRGRWRLVFDNDWIIREGQSLYVCRPEAFAAQFEQVPA